MKVPRNAPCPCGSGNKYKKCCLRQDQNAAAAGRNEHPPAARAGDAAILAYTTDLDDLSNRANDLIHSRQWNEAEACCQELLERFPKDIDGHHRFYEYYNARGDLPNAMTHAMSLRRMLAHDPEGFDPDFLAELDEDITRFQGSIPPDPPPD